MICSELAHTSGKLHMHNYCNTDLVRLAQVDSAQADFASHPQRTCNSYTCTRATEHQMAELCQGGCGWTQRNRPVGIADSPRLAVKQCNTDKEAHLTRARALQLSFVNPTFLRYSVPCQGRRNGPPHPSCYTQRSRLRNFEGSCQIYSRL
jgi:hypothetical protein